MKTQSALDPIIEPRFRVRVGREIALGPGKVELLELVQQTGSIAEAARRMGMSYMRAWTLIRTMNECFKQPLVEAVRGGSKGGGGAKLTETGTEVMQLYLQMEKQTQTAVAASWRGIRRFLKG